MAYLSFFSLTLLLFFEGDGHNLFDDHIGFRLSKHELSPFFSPSSTEDDNTENEKKKRNDSISHTCIHTRQLPEHHRTGQHKQATLGTLG